MRQLAILALVLGLALPAAAREKGAKGKKDGKPHVLKPAAEIEWKDGPKSLPPGARMSMLEGDLKKKGFFAARLKLPAGYRVPPHWHPVHERVTVISGTFQLGMGETFDEKSLKDYPAGSYLAMPPKMRHFAMCRRECEIQLATNGPWDIVYLNPKDDPRKQTKR